MRSTGFLLLGLLVLAAAAAFLVVWPGSGRAHAESCFCSPGVRTTDPRTVGGPDWRGPASCGRARSVLIEELRAGVQCLEGPCAEQLVITRDCEMDDPKWYPVTGFIRYACNQCAEASPY